MAKKCETLGCSYFMLTFQDLISVNVPVNFKTLERLEKHFPWGTDLILLRNFLYLLYMLARIFSLLQEICVEGKKHSTSV